MFDNFSFFNYEVSPISVILFVITIYISYYFIAVKQYPKLLCSNDDLNFFFSTHLTITRQIFWPLIWGFEARLQTVIGSIFRPFMSVAYEREVVVLTDGGEVMLDWAFTHDVEGIHDRTDKPTIPVCIFLPGLTGCSQSNYMTHLVNSVSEKGFRAVVLNYRGKGGSKLKTPKTYCATSTQDFHEVVKYIQLKNPDAPLIACGISLGGMILFNYLAKYGQETPLEAGMVISVAWNIYKSATSLETPINRILFNKTLTGSLADDVRDNSELFESAVDLTPVLKSQTLREFDTHFTARIFGYNSVDDYYNSASPHVKVASINTPLLCLTAGDDPFAPFESIPFECIKKNPYMIMIYTSHGGHVGFIEGVSPRGPSLMDKLLQQYIGGIFNNIDEFRKLRLKIDCNVAGTQGGRC